MLEVFWQDFVFELIFAFNNEAVAIICPLDYVIVLFILQNSIGLYDKIRNVLLAVQPLL
jgi:hypothetical protein